MTSGENLWIIVVGNLLKCNACAGNIHEELETALTLTRDVSYLHLLNCIPTDEPSDKLRDICNFCYALWLLSQRYTIMLGEMFARRKF